ncbi:Hpt domain-containing protein [Photobacterium makurazakiensis]|uniref:Hpt domain-containing protein n=1 Tax=Photobacterium makurazakiensis TaxID=2910234 RepID=UPI003D12961B
MIEGEGTQSNWLIPNVDSASALKRCANNKGLYIQLLCRFVEKHQQGISIEDMTFEEVLTAIHSIKGSASNLGIDDLSNRAKRLELLLKSSNSIHVDEVELFSNHLIEQCKLISTNQSVIDQLEKSDATTSHAVSSGIEGKPTLVLIEKATPSTRNLISQLKEYYRVVFFPDYLKAMSSLSNNHDPKYVFITMTTENKEEIKRFTVDLRRSKGEQIRVFLLVNGDFEIDYQQCRNLGVDDVFTQPLNIELLRRWKEKG